MSSDQAAREGGGDLEHARLFAAAWAVAALFHLLGKIPVDVAWQGSVPLDALVAACALGLLVRPSSVAALLALGAAEVASAIAEAPVLSNHWLLAALVDLALLSAAVSLVATGRGRARPPAQASLWRVAAPVLRWQVILFYLLAALHKTNSSYLDPGASCAAIYAAEIARTLGASSLAGYPLALLAAWGSLLVEWTIPILLLVARLRVAGVVLGALFHGVLALDLPRHFFDFSAVMYALLIVFLPAPAIAAAAARWAKHVSPRRRAAAAAVVTVALTATLATERTPWALPVASGLAAALWLCWAALLIAGLAALLRSGSRLGAEPGALVVPRRWLWVFPALVLINGTAPYLGWKTGGAFNMYSNLRVEGERPNHLLLPGSLGLSPRLGDLVAIVSSSDPELEAYGRRDLLVSWFELRDYLSHRPETAITFRRDGELHQLARAADDPELVAPVPWWRRKLLLFRPVDAGAIESCRESWGPAR